MVVFVCSSCNSSLRINQVAVHSCNSKFSCLSCNMEFSQQNVKSHVKCISEAEKYKGIDFNASKNENKNIEKRNNWCNTINEFLNSYETTDSNLQKVIASIKNQPNMPDKEKPFCNFVKSKLGYSVLNSNNYAKVIWTMISPLKDALKKPISITKNNQVNAEAQKRKLEEQEESVTKKIKKDTELPETKKKSTRSDNKLKAENNNNIETCSPKEKKFKKTKKNLITDVATESPVEETSLEIKKQTKSNTNKDKKPEIVEEKVEKVKPTKKKNKKIDTETAEENEKEINESKEKKSKPEKNTEPEIKGEVEKQSKIKTKKNKKPEIIEKIGEENKKKTKKSDKNKGEIKEKVAVEKPKEKKIKTNKVETMDTETKVESRQIKSKPEKNKKLEIVKESSEEIVTQVDNERKTREAGAVVLTVKGKEKKTKKNKNPEEKIKVDEKIPSDDKPRVTENMMTNYGINNDKENVAVKKKLKSKTKSKKLNVIEESKEEVEEIPKKPKKDKKQVAESGDNSKEIEQVVLTEKSGEVNSMKRKGKKINKDVQAETKEENNAAEKQRKKRKLN